MCGRDVYGTVLICAVVRFLDKITRLIRRAFVQARILIGLNDSEKRRTIMNANDQRLELINPALLTGLGLALIIWTQKIAKLVLHEKPA